MSEVSEAPKPEGEKPSKVRRQAIKVHVGEKKDVEAAVKVEMDAITESEPVAEPVVTSKVTEVVSAVSVPQGPSVLRVSERTLMEMERGKRALASRYVTVKVEE
jgi:hypothetical protein